MTEADTEYNTAGQFQSIIFNIGYSLPIISVPFLAYPSS